ncbi:MAG TPA: hypothetical protein VK508_21265 [Cyclobacteriaceae bacterium]|nr:hypothetical protein [Cyclobacteriaceae bacterium]
MSLKWKSFVLMLLAGFTAFAQHDHAGMEHGDQMDHADHTMSHAFSLSLPMNRNGSGTGWLPDQTPMYAWMTGKDRWSYMLHGAIFVRQSFQNLNNNYRNGGKNFDAPAWIMGMAQYQTRHNGLFLFRAMMSLDPVTVGGNGYPLLFQSGETYNGVPLVNRQHPHDLFSELAVGYTQKVNDDLDVSLYLAYPGEPSIGPTAFMHRISSLNNPDAPLGHHWQDATHVTFGVATLGVRYKKFKLEGSSFTGREPDEDRYDLDKPRFDSYSYRLSFAPSDNFVLQASKAFIKSPEPLDPDENVDRTTLSVIYAKRLDDDRHLTGAAVWGLNQGGGHHREHSILVESNYQHKRVALYGRYEFVEKSPHELQLPLINEDIIPIHAFTLGSNYQLGAWLGTSTALGVQATVNKTPGSIEETYGKTPLSVEAYVRVIPVIMKQGKGR